MMGSDLPGRNLLNAMKATIILRWVAAIAVWQLMGWHTARGQVTPLFTINCPVPTLQNLQGAYYNNMYLTNAVFTRADATINFNWGSGSPDPRINVDHFSVRWTGTVVPRYSESYTFSATSDDGFRLYINGQLVIDAWVDEAATEHDSAPIALTAGVQYPLVAEYYEDTGAAEIQLSWSSASQAEEIVGTPPNPSGAGDAFGTALASIGGGRFAVATPSYPTLDLLSILISDVGHLWYSDAAGALQSSPTSPGSFPLEVVVPQYFGTSLSALANGSLLVGWPGYGYGILFRTGETRHPDVGSLYLISSPGTGEVSTWVGNPAGAADGTYFGHTVAGLSSTQFAASSLTNSGTVYVFTTVSTNAPAVTAVITNPNAAPVVAPQPPYPWTWSFGSALSALGANGLLIGSPRDSFEGDGAGSVFLYDLAGNLLRKIHNPTGKVSLFGSAVVAVDDHRFLIGAPNAALALPGQLATNTTAGAVYLYDDTGTLLYTFTAPDVSVSGNFGAALAMLGPDRLLIGSPSEQVGAISGAGRVHLFNVAGIHLESIDNPTPDTGDSFGASLCALDGHRFVVGAPGDSTLQTGAGSVYGYDAPSPTADLGAEIPRPNNLDISGTFPQTGPTVTPAGAAFWHVASQKLFAVQPGSILVSWPVLGGQTYNWQASLGWPTNNALYQVHVTGQTPVDLSGGGAYANAVLEATTADANSATVSNTLVFSAQSPGLSLLMLSAGNPSSNAIRFQFVQSIAWNDPAYLYDHAPATVGQPISDPAGFQGPVAGSPQVVLPNAVYCPAPVFDPSTRTGTIIPVNQDLPGNPAADLVVAYYQRGTLLYDPVTSLAVSNAIFWPYQPVRFEPQWPTNAPHLVIASQQGTGVIDPTQFVNWQLYYQNDPNQPGFNPNDEHALRLPYNNGEAVFALRSDLGTPQTSQPFVLIQYQDPATAQWRMKAWQVVAEESHWFFNYPALAGLEIIEPTPLNSLDSPVALGTRAVSGPWWQGLNTNFFFAKAAGDDGHSTANVVMQYFYRSQPGFYVPGNYLTNQFVTNLFAAVGVAPTNTPPANTPFPWLDLYAQTPGTPQNVTFVVSWPTNPPPVLSFAETLFAEKPAIGGGFLPSIAGNGTNVTVIYEQAMATGGVHSVQLILPTNAVSAPLKDLPLDIQAITNLNYTVIFPGLPPDLRQQVWWDGNLNALVFSGLWVTNDLHAVAEPLGYLLLNVLTPRDKAELLALATNSTPADTDFQGAVNALAISAGQVMVPEGTNSSQYDSLALTAANARAGGYVTLAFNNAATTVPILELIQVGCPTYQGDVEDIQSSNPFDVKQTLQYSGDFGGNAGNYNFEWQRTLSVAGKPDPNGWADVATGPGLVNVTIAGSGPDVLADHFFRCRYQPLTNGLCGPGWSAWSDGDTLAPGWIGNILSKINLFDQRFGDYATNQVDTVISALTQAGPRWIGNVPLTPNASDLGLIQIYETVLRVGEQLSLDNPTYNASDTSLATAVDTALMDAAGRLADLYMLFGNEAYAEATDPTVSFGDQTTTYATQASSIFCFEGDPNAPTLLAQELALLRGRDDSYLPPVETYPVYNRLWWNISGANQDGTVAYVETFCGGEPANAPSYFPQGHGDAWGHYLTALTGYYGLFRNPKFSMIPALDIEAVQVGGVTVDEGLMHERKFATAAAARAQTGLNIINLTYRSLYQEDPTNQWQGYYDSNTNRAWGVSEWGMKAGLATYFDWVTANAILPHADTNAADAGTIAQVDRTTVSELGQIASTADNIQSQLDNADQGLNPLGVPKDLVPMDIDPTQVSQGVSHFQQVYNKAVAAMNNCLAVFNYAEQSTEALRQQADTVQQFQDTVANQEASYNNQLITIFGTPYPQDPNYPPGYSGPDINGLDFNYIDYQPITGVPSPTAGSITNAFVTSSNLPNGGVVLITNAVTLTLADDGLQFVKPASWTQPRVSPGTIQQALGNLLQAHQKFDTALLQYDALLAQVQDQADLLESQYGVNASQINVLDQGLNTQRTLDQQIHSDQEIVLAFQTASSFATYMGTADAEALPKVLGLATDATAPARSAIQICAALAAQLATAGANAESLAELRAQQDAQLDQAANNIAVTTIQQVQGITNDILQLQQLVRQEPIQRSQLDNLLEAITEAAESYRSTLEQGAQVLDARTRFRSQTAQQVQEYRYKDMAFRIFRDDGLSKFDAQFDMAALYVYLAAKAYDFETCFLPGDPRGPGENFMQEIIRTRAIGLINNGIPVPAGPTGDPGLADPLARMWNNWYFNLNGQLGINNQDHLTERFSLRSELFRVQTNQNSTVAGQRWRQILTQAMVPDILALPEFQRYCSPPVGAVSPSPGIVLFFGTTIKAGENFFGWPLGGGDSYFNPSAYATKVAATGIWFDNYDATSLPNTPNVYLIPVGDDVFYAPGSGGVPRQFTVLDEALPTPALSASDLSTNTPGWIPIDSMSEPFGNLRQFDEFQAYPDSGQWSIAQATSSTRLIGRSVWNTRWMLIIPAVSLGGPPTDTNALQNAVQTFINGARRDGNGISDIKLLFQTYTYTGQ